MKSERVRSFESKAVSWIRNNLERFNPLRRNTFDAIMGDLKAMCELLFLCSLKKESNPSGLPRDYRMIVESLYNNVFCKPAYQELIIRRPDTILHMLAYISFRACGYEHAWYRQRLERVLATGYPLQIERLPHRNMDLSLMIEKGGFDIPFPSPESFFEQTLLARHPNIYYLNEADVYAITHTIFYYTDFKQRGNMLPSSDHHYLKKALPSLLAFYIRQGNWDLVGELLICLIILDISSDVFISELYDLGWNCFLGAQDAEGWIRGPQFLPEEYARITAAEDKAEYAFAKNYHTTIVGLIAVAMCDLSDLILNSEGRRT